MTAPSATATDGSESPSDAELIERLRAIGVTFASECLAISRSKCDQLGLPASRIEDVIQWMESQRVSGLLPYGGGAVNRRLTNLDLLVLSAGEGWPGKPNADWALAWGREAERRRREEERTREQSEREKSEQSRLAEAAKYTQLEFQFRSELERLRSDREAIVQLLSSGSEASLLVSLARQQGLESQLVRRAVLRCLAALAG